MPLYGNPLGKISRPPLLNGRRLEAGPWVKGLMEIGLGTPWTWMREPGGSTSIGANPEELRELI
jgi:hypothetical protein